MGEAWTTSTWLKASSSAARSASHPCNSAHATRARLPHLDSDILRAALALTLGQARFASTTTLACGSTSSLRRASTKTIRCCATRRLRVRHFLGTTPDSVGRWTGSRGASWRRLPRADWSEAARFRCDSTDGRARGVPRVRSCLIGVRSRPGDTEWRVSWAYCCMQQRCVS